ncbi:hypothetical protein LR48_Vigan11g068500 [Vigna angularis]|uniref:Uncharacterized protein n=1 Tax=Phaseolus angularis TaxID=3914 RepID=A0A0L9VS07_PHAAN|nr:hypothetical protein LR48_Vigan11g068500 [Vigna angularis]
MKGDCYPELVEVFYNNIKVVDGNINSCVKGVNIVINNDTWLQVVGLKDEGRMSHLLDCQQNRWTKKTQMFKDYMRYPGRCKKEKGFLHRWLDKEEKSIAYIIDWVLLPRRFHYDKLTLVDLYLLNAIMFRTPTGWRNTIASLRLTKTMRCWCFKGEEDLVYSSGSTSAANEDCTNFFPEINFESVAADQFRILIEKVNQLEIKFDDALQQRESNSSDENSMETSKSE